MKTMKSIILPLLAGFDDEALKGELSMREGELEQRGSELAIQVFPFERSEKTVGSARLEREEDIKGDLVTHLRLVDEELLRGSVHRVSEDAQVSRYSRYQNEKTRENEVQKSTRCFEGKSFERVFLDMSCDSISGRRAERWQSLQVLRYLIYIR